MYPVTNAKGICQFDKIIVQIACSGYCIVEVGGLQFSDGTYDDPVILVGVQFPDGEQKSCVNGNSDGLAKKLPFINLIEVSYPPPREYRASISEITTVRSYFFKFL